MSDVRESISSFRGLNYGFLGKGAESGSVSGVTPGTYGGAGVSLELDIASTGVITDVTEVSAGVVGAVQWSLTTPVVLNNLDPVPWDTIDFDTGNVIAEVAAGTQMTFTEPGVYMLYGSSQRDASEWSFRVNGTNRYGYFNRAQTTSYTFTYTHVSGTATFDFLHENTTSTWREGATIGVIRLV